MNAERWGQVGELFDLAASLPPAERTEWLRAACAGDDGFRAEVEALLDHDDRADRTGFLGDPVAPAPAASAAPPADATPLLAPPRASSSRHERFSPRVAIAAARPTRAGKEARSIVQARLRELPFIYVLIFGVMLLVRPLVLGRIPPAIVVPFAVVSSLLMAVAAILSVRLSTHRFSLAWLRRIELGMTLALAVLMVVYECLAILGPAPGEGRIMAERIMKNSILLLSLLMIIDAAYVPKSWRRAASVAAMLAFLPAITLGGASLVAPGSVHWVAELRADGNKPLAILAVDTVSLLTLAAISTFAARKISRLRSEGVEARRFGQYRLGERIATGGMGEVFLAEHELLKRPCAIKLIRPEVVRRLGSVERFEREVRINATLSHPNTVEIFDYGRTEDGTYYYVMEYLPGMSLADLVERHGRLPPGRAVYLLRQAALALGEAHEAGLIHRDIKPSNIFAARRGGMDDVAKLLDFGLVRPSAGGPGPPVAASGEGQILGTPLSMSPEQGTGSRALDARSDISSLGAVAYFLLTGRPPFDAATPIEAIIAHARDPVTPPSRLRPEVPADLEAAVLRCLAKSPADRFASAEALEAALGRCGCAPTWDKAKARAWWMSGKLA